MSHLTDIFFSNKEKMPDKIAICADGQELTYRQFGDLFLRIANFLSDNGVKPGDKIGVPMINSIENIALFFAAAELGVCIVPTNPTLPVELIQTAFDRVGVNAIIARERVLSKLDCKETILFCTDGNNALGITCWSDYKNAKAERLNVDVADDALFILTLTSGSTGTPKPIALTQQNKVDRAFAHKDAFKITSEDIILAATPLYHSLAERLVIMPMLLGATSVMMPRFTPKMWLECIEANKVTFTIAVSAQLAQLIPFLDSTDMADVSSLRCVVSSSALLDAKTRSTLIDRLECDFYEMYGLSECSTVTSIFFKEAYTKQKSVGKPLPVADVLILKEDGTHAAANEIGEIAVKTKLMFAEYYGMKDITEASYSPEGYFKTGDLGYLDEDGFLYFSGRKKDLIISGAVNVYPNDIENVVGKIPGVKECAAFAFPDEALGEVVALAVVLDKDSTLTKKDVVFYCAKHLADFQQPRKIYFMEELPKNTMGKLQKNRILGIVEPTLG